MALRPVRLAVHFRNAIIQFVNSRRLQMGVRAGQDDPWFLTPVYDCGFDIRGFWQNAISMYSGRGAVDYTQLLIDYWHYREGLSGPIL